jgi:5-methylcytosine-specific restriction endonuclease McrA
MRNWSLDHVSNGALLRDLKSLAAQESVHLARLLAHLGEVQSRKLYREAAQPHMYAYCVNVLHYSEDAAGRRIHVAGVARRIPALLEAIAEGRLHLSGACEIAAHLTLENAEQVLAAVTHKTREQIKVVVAALAPKPDLPEQVTPIPKSAREDSDVAPLTQSAQVVANIEAPSALAQMGGLPAGEGLCVSGATAVAEPSVQPSPPGRVTPLAPERYGVQFTVDQATRELLERAKELLDEPEARRLENVFKRALTLLVRDLERRKCGKSDKPRKARRPKSPENITQQMRQEVWVRDHGQCTFVNEEGRRCPSRGGLEVDHVDPKARAKAKGRTTALTASDLRLLCRPHNQLMAERLYGAAFMQHKRESATALRSPEIRQAP